MAYGYGRRRRRRTMTPAGATKVRAPRPAFSARARECKRRGKCVHCHTHFNPGDRVIYVRVKTARYHEHCAPTDVLESIKKRLDNAAILAAAPTAREAALLALKALEDAVVAKAKETGITEEMTRAFDKYQKIKARAIHVNTPPEEASTATQLAVVALVKLVWVAKGVQ